MNTFVIRDCDDPATLFGLLRTSSSKSEVEEVLKKLKSERPSDWDVEYLMEGLANSSLADTISDCYMGVDYIDV